MKKLKLIMKETAIFTLLLLIVISTGCKDNKSTGEKNLDIVVSVGPEPRTIDPTMNSTMDAGIYIVHIFEGLTIKDKNMMVVGGAAESWERSDNNMSYTFKIRSNAKWSDGKPVTAHDFVYAWRRMVDPMTAALYASHLDVLKNAVEIGKGLKPVEELGVKAIDDNTLLVEFNSPITYFEDMAIHTAYTPLREDIVENNNDKWTLDAKTYIGNGAFKLTKWEHNSKIIVEKNTNYWDIENIVPNTITFELIEDPNTAMAGIKTDKLYFYNDVPPNERDTLIKENLARAISDTGLYYYSFNVKKTPYDNAKLRRALSLAIDRDYIVNTVLKGGQIPAGAIVPVDIYEGTNDFRKIAPDYFSIKKEDYQKNIEEAKILLAEAGYPEGKGLPVIEFKTNPGSHVIVAESIQSMWKENIGVNMTIAVEEWSVFMQTRKDGNYELAREGWSGGYNHPIVFLRVLNSADALNNGKYSNAEYDKALDLALRSDNGKERIQSLLKAEKIAMDDMAVIPIYYYTRTVMQNPKLVDVNYDLFGRHRFHQAYIKK